jgi:predicted RNase H-like nuclease (RuvC/YqgF family)
LSKLSGKSYIDSLHKELEEEKRARLRLEQELDELRKISGEITSHLGINTNSSVFNQRPNTTMHRYRK